MQYLKVLALFILCLNASIAGAQDIDWQENRPLTWEDFKGPVDKKVGSVAVTAWNISYSYRYEIHDSIYVPTFKISNRFLTRSSWRHRGYSDEYVLSHEQLHFDISELFARKLALAFKKVVYTKNIETEAGTIFSKLISELGEMQVLYDKETKHSDDRNMQYRWNLFIYLELKKLSRNY